MECYGWLVHSQQLQSLTHNATAWSSPPLSLFFIWDWSFNILCSPRLINPPKTCFFFIHMWLFYQHHMSLMWRSRVYWNSWSYHDKELSSSNSVNFQAWNKCTKWPALWELSISCKSFVYISIYSMCIYIYTPHSPSVGSLVSPSNWDPLPEDWEPEALCSI